MRPSCSNFRVPTAKTDRRISKSHFSRPRIRHNQIVVSNVTGSCPVKSVQSSVQTIDTNWFAEISLRIRSDLPVIPSLPLFIKIIICIDLISTYTSQSVTWNQDFTFDWLVVCSIILCSDFLLLYVTTVYENNSLSTVSLGNDADMSHTHLHK